MYKNNSTQAFTIVELLIVIVVIAILAAISVVAYNGIQNRANDTSIQSDLSTIAKKLEAYRITNNDQYPNIISDADVRISKGAYGNHYTPSSSNGYNLLYCRDNSVPAFALIGRSKSGTTYAITNKTSVHTTSQDLTTYSVSCQDQGVTEIGGTWNYNNGSWRPNL